MSRARNTRQRPLGGTRTFYWFIFLIVLAIYWLVARTVQGLYFLNLQPQFWTQFIVNYPLLEPFTPLVNFVVGLLDPTVLRHFIPVLGGIWLAQQVTVDWVQQFYGVEDRNDARYLFGRLKNGSAEKVKIERRTFAQDRIVTPLLNVGGPGYVTIAPTDAAVTEINGRYATVLRAGKRYLRPFETIRSVVDLREQESIEQDVQLTTKEGLTLFTSLFVTFRINQLSATQTPALYDVDVDSVRRAALVEIVSDHDIERWDDLPRMIALEQLREMVSQRRLDELLDPRQIYERSPHPQLENKLEGTVRQILAQDGIELISLRMGAFQMTDDIYNTLLAYWQAFHEKAQPVDPTPHQPWMQEDEKRKRAREKMIKHLAAGFARVQEQTQYQESPLDFLLTSLQQDLLTSGIDPDPSEPIS